MKCPHCDESVELTWKRYWRSRWKSHTCPHCGERFRITYAPRHFIAIFGSWFALALVPSVLVVMIGAPPLLAMIVYLVCTFFLLPVDREMVEAWGLTVAIDIDNPDASPPLDTNESARVTRGHIALAVVSFSIGAASFAVGLSCVEVMTRATWAHDANDTLGNMIAGCSLYLGFGASWMVAGRYYWKQRYRRGLVASGFGVLIPVVLFAILGF